MWCSNWEVDKFLLGIGSHQTEEARSHFEHSLKAHPHPSKYSLTQSRTPSLHTGRYLQTQNPWYEPTPLSKGNNTNAVTILETTRVYCTLIIQVHNTTTTANQSHPNESPITVKQFLTSTLNLSRDQKKREKKIPPKNTPYVTSIINKPDNYHLM